MALWGNTCLRETPERLKIVSHLPHRVTLVEIVRHRKWDAVRDKTAKVYRKQNWRKPVIYHTRAELAR